MNGGNVRSFEVTLGYMRSLGGFIQPRFSPRLRFIFSSLLLPAVDSAPIIGTPKAEKFCSSILVHGLTRISEDSSEIVFLLVENYNYDRSIWSSDRMGIFGKLQSLDWAMCLFIEASS